MTEADHPVSPEPQKAGSKTLQVLDALRSVAVPEREGDLVSLRVVRDLKITGTVVRFNLALPEELLDYAEAVAAAAQDSLEPLEWVTECEVGFAAAQPPPDTSHLTAPGGPGGGPAVGADARLPQSAEGGPSGADSRLPLQTPEALHRPLAGVGVGPDKRAPGGAPLPGVKHVIAVGSGKGGVGKSTVAVNLALALAQLGYRTGLLDADVYGPSIPLMLGVHGNPLVNADQKLIPLEAQGLKVMSMGFLLRPDQAVVWRGPMVHGVVRQFIADVEWGELDFLIVDLPPGTGDAPLSLVQALPLTAGVVVTTPQEVAASVAQKAMSMFERMGLRTLGVIENMSYFVCPSCGHESDIFDRGGGKALAAARGVPFLGEIPLDVRMRKGSDVGQPVMAQFPDSELARQLRDTAERLAQQVGAAAQR
jgi:ATP-binding protein involved in chromosome partitioning